jgi:potassium/sodium efflux P-type ATPase
LEKYGYNELKFKKQSALVRFLLQFRSALVYVLLLAAVVTAVLEMWLDSAVIFVVVIANAIIGFIQEGKAEASMEVLSKMMVLECTIRRDGEHKDIPARELVPGDIVLLEEGDRVPADLRLFYVRDLSIDEAPLTGESVPVDKTTEPLIKPDLPPGDQRCIAFSGTFVSRGAGYGIVVATASQTEIGKIAELMKETKAEAAPLMRKMAQFTKVLIIAILILAAINLILGAALGGYDLVYSFLTSVSLAVAAIPEGLPAILTIALAAGARAMARRNALIRRLPAVETLGSATVICSDKTGTLTKSEMTVVRIYCGKKIYSVTGSGYDPTGEFLLDNKKVDPLSEIDLAETLSAGLLCNSAFLRQTDEKYEISGDPTEGALVVSGTKAGMSEAFLRLDQIPFGSEHRYMATLHQHEEGNIIYVKGSPERVLSMCKMQLVNGNTEPIDPSSIADMVEEMAGDALRVLGLAYKRVPTDKTAVTSADLEDMVFLGLQGMIDPPRQEAIDAVHKCKRAGIRVIMITGDHAKTAQAIATQLGIGDGSAVLTGEDLSKMSDDELYEIVERISVYARVAPIDKFRITTQLQKRGHIVAMTGDGVNDAPALKAADIGVAMGLKGTDVSREAADMVLVDDNFASIVAAVEEGRHVFENIRKVILYTLPTNGGQALLVIGAIIMIPFIPLFAERLPLEPIQILWINLYDAVVLALPLLWEPREQGLLDRRPRDPKEPIANRLFFRKVILVSLIMAGAAFAVYYGFGNIAVSGAEVDETRLTQAQTAAFLTVMMVHIFYLLTSRSLTKSTFRMNPFSNKLVIVGISISIVLHLIIVYALPRVGFNPFRVEPFPAEWWGIIVALGFLGLLLVEVEEFAVGRLNKFFTRTSK